jgi:hypothetical protein
MMNFGAATQGFSRKLAAAVALAMALYHIYVIIPPMDFISPDLREVFRGRRRITSSAASIFCSRLF